MKSRLKEIVKSRGITQKFICDNVGINKSTMSKLFRGETLPTLPVAYRIAKLLELKIEDIWYIEE